MLLVYTHFAAFRFFSLAFVARCRVFSQITGRRAVPLRPRVTCFDSWSLAPFRFLVWPLSQQQFTAHLISSLHSTQLFGWSTRSKVRCNNSTLVADALYPPQNAFYTRTLQCARVIAVARRLQVCLSLSHKPVLYRNGWTDRTGFWRGFVWPILHSIIRKFRYLQNKGRPTFVKTMIQILDSWKMSLQRADARDVLSTRLDKGGRCDGGRLLVCHTDHLRPSTWGSASRGFICDSR